MDLLESKVATGLGCVYVLEEDKVEAYNPMLATIVRKVPTGFYLLQTIQRQDGTMLYELIPKDQSKVSIMDLHYVEGLDFRNAFGKGYVTFATEEGEA